MRKSESEPSSANSPLNYEVSYETSTTALTIKQANEFQDKIEDPVLFWKQELSIASPFLDLPVDFPRSSVTSNQINHVFFSLSDSRSYALKQLTDQLDVNLFTFLLTAYNALLFRYTKQEDITIGFLSPENNLDKTEVSDNLINTKFFRTNLSGNRSFTELLKRVHETVLAADKHKGVPYETLEKAMKSEFEGSYTGLCNVMFSYRNAEVENNEISDAAESLTLSKNYPNNVDLALSIKETPLGLKGVWSYNSELFEAATIKRIAKHFEVLLETIAVNPQQSISLLHFLTDSEHSQLTLEWNSSKIDFPSNKCIHEIFEEQVKKTPDAIALVFEGKKLTYHELNVRSNQLAHYLYSKEIKPEALIPICIGRSLEMIIGILGILKAGGAYVPIDPNYPLERIAYLLEDIQPSFVVCDKESKIKLNAFKDIETIVLSGEGASIKEQPANNLNKNIFPNHLAYIIYTSGSTGKPKGVMIEHRSLMDHCYGVIESADLKDCKSFALFSPLVFDAGHSLIHSSFILGSSLHVLSEELIMNSEKVVTYLYNNSIDCIKIVPSLWLSYANLLKIALPKKVIIFGGEAFPLVVLNNLIKSKYSGSVYNHYGPTEVTIGKCIHKVSLNKIYRTVPIGKPFSNTQLYVLDDQLQLCPVGIEGELYIGGDGLARGYLNKPALTAEKFISNPFTNSGKIYKTGDKVRWLADGNIEYIGRADDQVKIQGHRIELGEIEDALLQSDLVCQAVVLAKADKKGNKLLIAYIVPAKPFNKEAIITFLSKKLPEYMVPVMYIELEKFPLTVNGKINKKELEALADIEKKYIAPKDEIERELATIWQDLFKAEKISTQDNFFELGGNSINAVALFAKIKTKFHKSLPLITIVNAPTICQLAIALKANTTAASLSSSLVPIQPNGFKTPLFAVHAGGGEILFYQSLSACLGTNQPFYALQAQGINGTELPLTRMEQMATYYISEIRKVQPEGPYYLAGYCLGARIIFEMAQQLTREGQKVALLANFNGISPVYYSRPASAVSVKPRTHQGRFSKMLAHFNNLAKLSLKEKWLYISAKLKKQFEHKVQKLYFLLRFKLYGLIFRSFLFFNQKVPGAIARRYVGNTLGILQNNYNPKPYAGSMIVFRSPGIYKEPYLGWKGFIKGEIKSFDIPGPHESRRDIMNEPYVQLLAKELKSFLDN